MNESVFIDVFLHGCICYLGLMCSSCSCSKHRHQLPALMDWTVRDDHPVHLYSPAEYGVEDSHPFHLGFTSVLRRRWSPSSSRFKFQQAEPEGRYDFYLHCTRFFCVFCQHCRQFHIRRFFFWPSSEVLCVYRSLFILSAFCLVLSGSIQNMFPLCCCGQYDCSFFIISASVATLHGRLPRDLQRVSLEWVWWVNFDPTSFFLQSV